MAFRSIIPFFLFETFKFFFVVVALFDSAYDRLDQLLVVLNEIHEMVGKVDGLLVMEDIGVIFDEFLDEWAHRSAGDVQRVQQRR